MVITTIDRAEELCEIAQKEWAADEVGYSGWINDQFVKKWSDPCHTEKELWQDIGAIIDGKVIVRLWWD